MRIGGCGFCTGFGPTAVSGIWKYLPSGRNARASTPANDPEGLLEALAAFVAINVETLKMHRDGAAPDAQIEPPVAQDIHRRGLRGNAQRMMKGEQRDAGAETDTARALRACGRYESAEPA